VRPEREPDTAPNPLGPAIAWVRERGGVAACARSVLLKTLTSDPVKVKAALDKAGAPPHTYALLNVEIHSQGRALE